MKKLLYIYFLSAFFSVSVFAQYKNNKWLLGRDNNFPAPGNGTKIEFNNNQRTITYDPRSIWFRGCFSGLSDKNDNWFVYTNGSAVGNKNHDTLVNGFGLSPGGDEYPRIAGYSIPGMALFFPKDTIQNLVYLFHQNSLNNAPTFPYSNQPRSLQLYYSVLDPYLGTNGTVYKKNKLMINDTLESGNILSVRHANGRDWWVVVKRFGVDLFYSILVTPDSIYAPISYLTESPTYPVGGQACFSPNAKYYASFSASSKLRVYDFDRCNGVLNNFRIKTSLHIIAGSLSFSPNSRYLYISTPDSLWQYDMQAQDVFASETFIAKYDGFTDSLGNSTTFWSHWLAPDGRIYVNSNPTSRRLHVINNPDMPGQACDFQQHSVSIPTYNAYTCPTSINLALYQEPGSPCDTLGVGLNELRENNLKLRVSPNPSNGRFSLEYLPQAKSGMLYVYDFQGKEVYREYVSPYTSIKNLDLSTKLANGIYGVSLVFGEEKVTKTIVIEKNN
ncbi:MAG: T9SS type A sorting domain-containing protein [Bacteroidota bacterium]